MTGLAVDVTVRRGEFILDAALDVPTGQVLAVLGPNGSGKSTLLDVVAGLLRPARGHVTWQGRQLSTAAGRLVPVAERRIGLLRQDPLLFPHMSALENVAFAVRARGGRGADRQRKRDGGRSSTKAAGEWLERLGAGDLADRRPGQLSGGQAARVALARALAAEPEVLLLDEPLAALDAAAAPELRQLLAGTLRESGLTTVLVSHDVLDAALLADRVAVLRDGALIEQGSRADVLGSPRTGFTAAFVGVNLVPVGFGGLRPNEPDDQATQLRFRPGAVVISPVRQHAENTWQARVRWLEPTGGGVRVRLTMPHADGAPDVLADVDPAAVTGTWLQPGALVWAHVPAEAVSAL